MCEIALAGGGHFGFFGLAIASLAVGRTLLGLGTGLSASEDAAQTEVVYLVAPTDDHVV